MDSFIQMGLDHPDCPVGLIAADECTYETFDEIVKEVRLFSLKSSQSSFGTC